MAEIHDSSKPTQIRNLLLVFGSGIAAALALAFGMLYYYNPPGAYLAKNALLAPANLLSMRYSEATIRGANNLPFVFDGIDFSYFDAAKQQWQRIAVDMLKYADFYLLIDDDASLTDVSDDVKNAFNRGHAATIILKARQGEAGKVASMDFLNVDFAGEGNYYRIQLREHRDSEGWAYFHHQGIYQQIQQLFVPSL